MKSRQKIIAATASLALALTGVTMVTPAHAAVSSVTVADCDAATLNAQTFNVPDGDNLQINFTTCAGLRIAGTFSGTFDSGWSNGIDTFGYDSTPRSFSGFGIPAPNTPLSAGSTVIYFRNTNTSGSGTADGSFTIVVGSGGGGGSSDSTASSSAPAPIFQQFGRPASGTCEATAPESLNWSGVAGGGWSESWAEWMNGGNGGAVCTRTLVYSTEQSRWIIG